MLALEPSRSSWTSGLANGRTWPGQKAGEVGHSTNNIKRILDGCVVQENFSSQTSIPLRGTSVCIFDTNAGKWKQTWGDNEGAYLDFVGEFKQGQMILEREAIGKDGKEIPAAYGWEKYCRFRVRLEWGVLTGWR